MALVDGWVAVARMEMMRRSGVGGGAGWCAATPAWPRRRPVVEEVVRGREMEMWPAPPGIGG